MPKSTTREDDNNNSSIDNNNNRSVQKASNVVNTMPLHRVPSHVMFPTSRLVSTISFLFVIILAVIIPFGNNNNNGIALSTKVIFSPGTNSTSEKNSNDINGDPPLEDPSTTTKAATKGTKPVGKYSPKRGKPIGAKFDANDLHAAYREIQSDYHKKAFNAEDQWRILVSRDDGIEVGMMEHPSDPNCPYVRLTAIIPTSVQTCWGFLELYNWDKNMPKMDPFYEGVDIHGEYYANKRRVHMILARKRTSRILAFGKRDLVFLSVRDEPLEDGTWVSGTVSVQTPSIPRQKGYTRAFQDSIAFYKPMDDNTKTHLTIVCRIDLNDSGEGGEGGFIPMWI